MADRCPSGFDQALLSGHMDGELTQQNEQRVTVHLEQCLHCRALLADLKTLREAAMTTQLREPAEEQWNERPQSLISRGARGLGWTLAMVWVVAVGGFALWQLLTSPEGLGVKLMVVGGGGALALLFLSVLLDRLHHARSDRYREVER